MRPNRFFWLALFMLLSLLLPPAAVAVEMDPYLYRVLIARVYLEYEDRKTEQNQSESTYNRFLQVYSLDSKGFIVSRMLVVYDAAISHGIEKFSSDVTADSENTVTDMMVRTTALPKSPIPLTLYGQRTENASTNAESTVRTTYGLNWFLKFYDLPKAGVSLERTSLSGGGNEETVQTTYRFDVSHEKGIFENAANYSLNTNEKESGTGDSASSTFNFTNKTRLSNYTTLFVGLTRSLMEAPPSTEQSLQAISASLNSSPGREFSQTHNYTFYENKSDTVSAGNSYNGDLRYIFNERLTSTLYLQTNTIENTSASATSETTSASVNASLDYNISNRFIITENLYYSINESNSDAGGNLSDYKQFSETTTISYAKRFTWANMGLRYSLGYRQEEFQGQTGSGVEHAALASFNNINFNRFVTFNASAAKSTSKSVTGGYSAEKTDYNVSAFNKIWKKYVSLASTHSVSKNESWVSNLNTRQESTRFDASTDYFKQTRINMVTEQAKRTDEVIGTAKTDNFNAAITHNRLILGGNLDLAANYSLMESVANDDDKRKTVSTTYYLKFGRPITRSIMWSVAYDYNKTTDDFNETISSNLHNTLMWQLRHWQLSAEHTHRELASSNMDVIENRLIVRLTRSFVFPI